MKVLLRGISLLLLVTLAFPTLVQGQSVCTDFATDPSFEGFNGVAGPVPAAKNCAGNLFACHPPELSGARYETLPAGCDPKVQACTVRATVPTRFPGNSQNGQSLGAKLEWRRASDGVEVGECGGAPGIAILNEQLEGWLQVSNFACANPAATQTSGIYTYFARHCFAVGGCERTGMQSLDLTPENLVLLFCQEPPKYGCPEDGPAGSCCLGPGGGSSPAGGGAGTGGEGTGPGAHLFYRAGGVGGPSFPGSALWRPALGRYWSHHYAERIVPAPNAGHVWLLTRWATFREFTDADADGFYERTEPSDEYRQLRKTAGGWELADLDGTVTGFDNAGLWLRSTDRNGNAKVATYTGGALSRVTLPDGRSESFFYAPSGKLSEIREVGTDGSTSRGWLYSWSGDDLARIDRTDGTALEFVYGDSRLPGYLTRRELVAADASRRVEAAWSYDSAGNVTQTWKGDASATGPNAVEKYSFSYDDLLNPTRTTVTDPLGKPTVYDLDRDRGAGPKPKITRMEGDCPVCGTGPNEQIAYGDAAHPLRATRRIDGKGHATLYTWDGRGQMTAKTEAFGTPEERTTTWAYHPVFPAFVTQMEMPSTSGGAAVRRTTWSYNAVGDRVSETRTGAEAGNAFSLTTTMTYNAAGQILTSDPPGYGNQDVTSYTYDPARGGLIQLTRTDPLVGTTAFVHDPYNRQVSVTDSNGVSTETTYDALNRVVTVTRKGAVSTEDLVTAYVYSPLKDLFRTVLPRGNVVENIYDPAGRLVAMERKPDTANRAERTLYTLDAYGHRTREDLQRWDGSAWATNSFTRFVYSTRCHLDQTIAADGALTEYDYDCDGNLAAVWDANHPRASNPPTQTYSYDARDRLTAVTQPWAGAGGGTAVTSYLYDIQDHLIRVTDAEGNPTTYEYSDRDLMTRELSPASGETLHAYNEHGEQVSETDARGLTMTRTVDALDRVTAMDYPDNSLDVTYAWDVGSFGLGQLGSITRNGQPVSYTYDRFGRVLQDGALTYAYDKNSNRTEIVYTTRVAAFASPVKALYTFDGAATPAAVVSSSLYKAFGPLARITLGNGVTETHLFDARYFPSGITATRFASLLNWGYTTDHLGNPLTIADRAYGYQDNHYFLTRGDGPWGTRSWTYDRIGNRLTETRGGTTDTYSYQPGPSGNGPRLTQAGSDSYAYDAAGDQILKDGSSADIHLGYDDARQLTRLSSQVSGFPQTSLRYDGRGFLRQSLLEPLASQIQRQVEPTYSSEGRLFHHYSQTDRPAPTVDLESDALILYFAGRPVLQLQRSLPPAPQRTFLDVDRTAFTWPFVEQLSLLGVTQGCGGGNYCGPNSVTRSQMAFFLLKAEHGADYTPPPCTTQRFNDVPCSQFFSDYINQLAEEGITLGCGGGNYCPSGIVARSQMAAFLLRAVEQGTGYAPPACTGLFADVPCSDPLAPWVEELARRGITSGCGPGMYCPLNPVTRGQMAIFLTRAFQLGWNYLTVDHLGTPILATNRSARALWQGGFEPFGVDWSGAEGKGIFLRFPGQWVDGSWVGGGGDGLSYNLHRWYEDARGRYTRKDPLGDAERRQHHLWTPPNEIERFSLYSYVDSNPLRFTDPLGLLKFKGCSPERQSKVSRAFKEYCTKIQQSDFATCMCDSPTVPKGLQNLCAANDRTIRCQTDRTGNCAASSDSLSCAWSLPLGGTIRLCEDAWTPGCGPLGCTLMHEMTHQLGHGGESKPKTVEKCLGCP